MTTLLKTTTNEERLEWLDKTYQAWQEGEIRADEALQYFCDVIAPVGDELKALDQTDKKARVYVSEVVEYLGGKSEVSGFGKLEMTSPSVTYTYDKKLVDRLTSQLRTEGLGDVAARLDACLKTNERAGSLRITRNKEG